MTYQSEYGIEDLFIKQLETKGYSKVSIANEDELKANFRNMYLSITRKS